MMGETIPSMGEIGLNQFAPYLINRISARWNADLAEALKAQNITTIQMRILAVLTVNSGLTVNELSVLTVTEQSTMSRTLDALEEQGLTRRQARSDDMRVREVHILDAGRAAFAQIWPTVYAHQKHMFESVSADEYQAFIATLHKMLRNIRKHDI
ncbi:MAG TPA: MarR family winged helix-turn-helix transcriptional regulator [Magnetospirillaceae bacterium]|jgi:DNA-binding MarR family transcriptional regulator